MHHAPYKTVFRSTPQSHYHNWMSAFKEKEVLKNCWTGVSFHIFISTRFRVPSLIYFDLLVILPQLLYYSDCCAASECTCRKLMKRWFSKVDWFRCGVDNENIDSHCSRYVKNPVTIFFSCAPCMLFRRLRANVASCNAIQVDSSSWHGIAKFSQGTLS